MKLKTNIVISLLSGLIGSFLFVYVVPLGLIERFIPNNQTFGATITTIQGSDTLSSSRAVINTNFSNLNTSKAEISDVSGTTTLSSLASVGTITTGTWNASTIQVPYGGTGFASIASGTVMYGKGASIGTTTTGVDGQVLVLSGGTPTWASITFDTALSYTVTGHWNFSYGFAATRASSTNATTTGSQYFTSILSSLLKTDSNGKLTGATASVDYALPNYTLATTTDMSAISNSFATSTGSLTVPSGVLTEDSTISLKGTFTCDNTANGDQSCTILLRTSTGTTLASCAVSSDQATAQTYVIDMLVVGNGSASSQFAVGGCVNYGPLQGVATVGGGIVENTSSVALASGVTLTVVQRSGGGSTNVQLTNFALVVDP